MKITLRLHNAPKEGEDQNMRQVIFRLRDGDKDIKVRTDLMAYPDIWDDSVPGYKRTTRLGPGGMKAYNDKVSDIIRHIEKEYSPMCDGKWLKETVNNFIRPVVEESKTFLPLPCEDNEKDTTLQHLDEGSVPAWFKKYADIADVSEGRRRRQLNCVKAVSLC